MPKKNEQTLINVLETKKLSIDTENNAAQILNDQNKSTANNQYLNGIKRGIIKWSFKSAKSEGASIVRYHEERGIRVNKIRIDFEDTNQQRALKSIIWYCASKNKGILDDDDFRIIQEILSEPENVSERLGIQYSILTLFPNDSYITKEPDDIHKIITRVKKILIHNQKIKKDFVTLVLATESELNEFRDSYFEAQSGVLSLLTLTMNYR